MQSKPNMSERKEDAKGVPNAKSTTSIDHLESDMRRHWYPMSFSKHLVRDHPVGLHVLGDPIVLFRDGGGSAVCLADVCAHRSAPLSIGRVTDGELECKYHGWRYDAEGRVAHIPALEANKTVPKSACARVYPCRESDGVVWVYPGASTKKGEEDVDLPDVPNLVPGGTDDDPTEWVSPFDFAVDLNIDHSLMVENLLDPAHLPFTHEGTLAKRSSATPLHMKIVPPERSDSIVGVATEPENRRKPPSRFTFRVPCHVVIYTELKPGYKFEQSMSCVPTRPGHMRLIFRQGRTFAGWLRYVPCLDYLMRKFSLRIVMQDYELLHGQQTRLNQGARPWNAPIQVDRLPSMYRRWHSRAMGGKPWFKGYDVVDIEDLAKSGCDTMCYYDEAVSPAQRGVDNGAYFRKYKQS